MYKIDTSDNMHKIKHLSYYLTSSTFNTSGFNLKQQQNMIEYQVVNIKILAKSTSTAVCMLKLCYFVFMFFKTMVYLNVYLTMFVMYEFVCLR